MEELLKAVSKEKIKRLEERFSCPPINSNSTPHIEVIGSQELFQKEKIILSTTRSNNNSNLNKINENEISPQNIFDNENSRSKIKEKLNFEIMNEKNSSIKSTNSNKNKQKVEKKVKTFKQTSLNNLQTVNINENLNHKRARPDENSQDYYCNEKLDLDIEFSSKNLISTAKFFSKITQKNIDEKKQKKTKNLDDFLINPQTNSSKKSREAKVVIDTNSNENLQKQILLLKSKQDQFLENEKAFTKEIMEKKKEVEKLQFRLSESEQLIQSYNIQNKEIEQQFGQAKANLVKYLRELEEIKRREKKRWLNEAGFRLMTLKYHRTSSKVIEVWEDGQEIVKYKTRLKEIENSIAELEKEKKKEINLLKKSGKDSTTMMNPDPLIRNNDDIDKKDLINFKISLLTKEKSDIKEKLEDLENQKIEFQLEYKRISEEEKCRYSGISDNPKEKWPVINNRYLLLSLLGKGGYSEVYKAYDLENNIEVACKVHQLSTNWSDSIKHAYIKHAVRENQIHKQIKHSKVVCHYDTMEIDKNSFCTILELCSGPDLYSYLKMNKVLSEKEAKMIITQILSGLKYLNELKNKIIHFDLKPQNILFNNGEVKISDFGLSKIMDEKSDLIELTSQGVGTYWYLPPECFETEKSPEINSKVDVWSIGVILYEMLFGTRPFGQGMTQEKILHENIIIKAKKVEFPLKPEVSNECKEFIKKCLSYNKLDRYNVIQAYESPYIRGIPKTK